VSHEVNAMGTMGTDTLPFWVVMVAVLAGAFPATTGTDTWPLQAVMAAATLGTDTLPFQVVMVARALTHCPFGR
jgi:hypothetical protein